MFKKVLSILLSLTFILSLMTPVYAQDTEKAQFLAAMAKTGAQLKKEKKIIAQYTDVSGIAEKLIKGSFEVAFDFAMKEEDAESAEGIAGSIKIDSVAEKLLANMTADTSTYGNDNRKINIDYYSDEDKVAIHVPEISDEFYYLDKNATEEDIENSAFGQYYDSPLSYIFTYNDFSDSFSKLGERASIKIPDGLYTPYKDLFISYINKGLFKSEGTNVVETRRGMIGTEKLTLTIKHNVFVAFTEELAALVEEDETLYQYLTEVYDSLGYGKAYDMDLASMVIASLVTGLSEIEIAEDFRYSIYVDNGGYILRNEVKFGLPTYYEEDAPIDINLKFDTAGKKNLLDEIKLGVVVRDGEDAFNFSMLSVGNNVPVNGVFGSDITVKAYSDYSYDDEDTNDMVGVFASYSWDTNKNEDNFSFTLSGSDSLNVNATKVPKDNESVVKFDMNGSLVMDTKKSMIQMKFHDIKLESEYLNYTVDVNILLRPIQASDVAIPEGKDVNILSLSEEQIKDLSRKMARLGL